MAFRYPKNYQLATNVNTFTSDTGSGKTFYYPTQPWDHIAICPGRYSAVRKVVFWVSITNANAVTPLVAKLRIFPCSSTNTKPYTIKTQVIGDGATFFSGGNPFGPASPAAGNAQAIMFDRIGPQLTTNVSGTEPGFSGCTVYTIEFDRFDATDSDFFAVWDQVATAGDNVFTSFQIALEVVSGPAVGNIVWRSLGIEVVQAPTAVNTTSTIKSVGFPMLTLSGSGNYPTYDTGVTDPVQGLTRFRYRKDDWNGIESVHIFARGGNKANNGTTTVRLTRVTDQGTVTAGGESVATVYEATLGPWGSNGQTIYYRSPDLKSLLVDGEDYCVDWKHDSNPASGAAISGSFAFNLEIIQRGFTRTTTFHEARLTDQNYRFGEPDSTGRAYQEQGYFNPLHYQDVPDEDFLSRENYHSLRRITQAFDPLVTLRHDAFFEGAEDQPPYDLTMIEVTPFTQGFNASPRWQYEQQAITANDPLQLAGARRLVNSKEAGHIWSGINDDHMGPSGLVYVFNVPTEEVLELGPLFQLGEFNPEGCASTAAGLGDLPGVLVITNGSVAPKKFVPWDQSISDAGIPPPFRGEVPSSITADSACSPTGGLEPGQYTYRYTFRNSCTDKESDPNLDDIVVDTSGRTPCATVTFSFAGVTIPGDAQIDQICLYRTVLGGAYPIMAKVGCIDLATGTVFTDTLDDEQLDFENDPLSLLNGPMPCTPIVAEFRNYLFAMGDIPELSPSGTVSVVNGSDEVLGDDDTNFNRCHVGKLFQVEGDCRKYEIAELLAPATGSPGGVLRIKLTEPYEGTTDTGLNYTICGRPNRVYVSEPLEPEYWPAANFIDVEPGDGDRIMGSVSNFNALVICKRRKTYRMSFNETPAAEVFVPVLISKDIGCIAPRSFAQVASGSVWLAERGLALFDGRTVQHLPESDAMNDLFVDPDNPRYVRRDANGRVIGAVGVHYPKREQYLLLLPTKQTTRGANLMLVWDTSLRNVTLYEFCQQFSAMEVAKDADGNERVYLGDVNGFVWIFDVGDTDGAGYPNSTGTVRGTVSASGFDGLGASFLDDDTASFVVGGVPELAGLSGIAGLSGLTGDSQLGLAGACVYVRPKNAAIDDPWIARTVYASQSQRLYVTPGWGELDPTGYDYMLAPIDFLASFKPTNYGTSDLPKRDWRHAIEYVPEQVATKLRVEILRDFETVDPISGASVDDGARLARVFDLSHSTGRQHEPVEREIHHYTQIRLMNFAPDEPIRLLNHILMKMPKPSR